jgi:hypothetical protein
LRSRGLSASQNIAGLAAASRAAPMPERRPLRLAFVAPSMEPAVGGAELTAWFLLQTAIACGHEAVVVTNRTPASLLVRRYGIRMEYVDGPDGIEHRLDVESPELVITQGNWALSVEEWCTRARIPFVLRCRATNCCACARR